MFDKKWEKFTNGKTFYMIDRYDYEIRKTKIYGYQYTKKGNFYVLVKMYFTSYNSKVSNGMKKEWEYEKPNRFHKSLKDAILFAKAEMKNSFQASIKKHEEEIAKRKKWIEEQREKINSITDKSIDVKEGIFDNYNPKGSRILL